jgi:hypothetical protein
MAHTAIASKTIIVNFIHVTLSLILVDRRKMICATGG